MKTKDKKKSKSRSLASYVFITFMGISLLSIVLLGSVIIHISKSNADNGFKVAAESLLDIGKM